MENKVFDESFIKNAVLKTFWQRVWGAWMVLRGKAGFIFYEIPPEKIYKKPQLSKVCKCYPPGSYAGSFNLRGECTKCGGLNARACQDLKEWVMKAQSGQWPPIPS